MNGGGFPGGTLRDLGPTAHNTISEQDDMRRPLARELLQVHNGTGCSVTDIHTHKGTPVCYVITYIYVNIHIYDSCRSADAL